jgi:hypothetical protein
VWGIKKWPGRILQGGLVGAQVINASGLGVALPPLGVVALAIGAAQIGVGILQHKSTEEGQTVEELKAENARLRERLESSMQPEVRYERDRKF